MFNRFYRRLPLVNFFVSGTALTGQVTILNPWYKKISLQIDKLDENLRRRLS